MNVGFEEILTTIGDWGIYQKKLLYLILIPYSFLLPWSVNHSWSSVCSTLTKGPLDLLTRNFLLSLSRAANQLTNQLNSLENRSHSSTIFMISTPKHVCKVPELESYSLDLQIFITDPSTIDKKKTSICKMLDIDYADYMRDLNIPENETDLETAKTRIQDYFKLNKMPELKKCDAWVFDKTDYDETAITKVGWVVWPLYKYIS